MRIFVLRVTMERDIELRMKGHLYEVATIDDKIIGNRQGFHSAEQGYLKTLTSVVEIAGSDLMDTVAEDIKKHIEEHHQRPKNQSVRREARSLVSKAGYPPDAYLNAA